jgi:lipoprotein-releasing system ATP-binding protein
MLKGADIHKYYGDLWVLKGVDLLIEKGEIVSIVGPSGSGKSTLLHILGTLAEADKGEIILENRNLIELKGRQLAAFRNKHIGFVFQFHHLLPEFTALEIPVSPDGSPEEKKRRLNSRLQTFCPPWELETGWRINRGPSQVENNSGLQSQGP